MPFLRGLLTSVLVPMLDFIQTSGFTNEGVAEKGERRE